MKDAVGGVNNSKLSLGRVQRIQVIILRSINARGFHWSCPNTSKARRTEEIEISYTKQRAFKRPQNMERI